MKVQRRGQRTWDGRLAQIFEHRIARTTLGLLIIISVLPLPEVEAEYRFWFLGIFGVEFTLRLFLFARGFTPRNRIEVAFLVIDFLAVVSFLPPDLMGISPTDESHWIRWLRIARLLVLLRYTRALAKDLYSIITRREQLQQLGLIIVSVASLAFVSAVILSQLRTAHDYDHEPGTDEDDFVAQLWWAFRQVESPDNLVPNLNVAPELAIISLTLTILGVFLVAYLIGIGATVVEQVLMAERRRTVEYEGHSAILGPVHESEELVREFVNIFEKNHTSFGARLSEIWNWIMRGGPPPRRHSLPRIALLGDSNRPPDFVLEPGMRWVIYREGSPTDEDSLERIGIHDVKRVLLLAPRDAGVDADAITLTTLTALRQHNEAAHVFAEVMHTETKELAKRLGGAGTFALDVPHFLGLFLTHHLLVPGVDELLRELLAAQGSEIYTHVFVDHFEHQALAARADETVDFADLLEFAREEYGICLTGVFLWDAPLTRTDGDLIPADKLAAWINPYASTFEIGGQQLRGDAIPLNKLGGLVAITTGYAALRDCARRFLRSGVGRRRPSAPPQGLTVANHMVEHIRVKPSPLGRILLLGYSPALASLLSGLADFIPGAEIILTLSARQDARLSLRDRLDSLQLTALDNTRPPAADGERLALANDAHVTIYTHDSSNLAAFTSQVIHEPVEAAVFLSDPESVDSDARTALRALRFAHALQSGEVPSGESLHILLEFQSLTRGTLMRKRLLDELSQTQIAEVNVSLVSTNQIRNYFMVHSAFVPGITQVYQRLLVELGAELIRLPVKELAPEPDDLVSVAELSEALLPKGYLIFALQTIGGEVITNPDAHQKFLAQDLDGVFVIGERARLLNHFDPIPPSIWPPEDA